MTARRAVGLAPPPDSPLTAGIVALLLVALAPPAVAQPAAHRAAHRAAPARAAPPAVTDTGRGPETFVLLTGLVGGVGGFRRVREPLIARGYRVVAVDPYHLSLESADVTFDALARRVDRVLAGRRARPRGAPR